MKPLSAMLGALLIAGAGGAMAQAANAPATTTICLDVSGQKRPVTCQAPASRLDQSEYICQCLSGGIEVTVPVCPAGVKPPPESAALERARRDAAQRGTLVGATFQGKPMCVDARNRAAGRY